MRKILIYVLFVLFTTMLTLYFYNLTINNTTDYTNIEIEQEWNVERGIL